MGDCVRPGQAGPPTEAEVEAGARALAALGYMFTVEVRSSLAEAVLLAAASVRKDQGNDGTV